MLQQCSELRHWGRVAAAGHRVAPGMPAPARLSATGAPQLLELGHASSICQDRRGGDTLPTQLINHPTGRDLQSSGLWTQGHEPPLAAAPQAQLSSTQRLRSTRLKLQPGRQDKKECRRTADASHHFTSSAKVIAFEEALYTHTH